MLLGDDDCVTFFSFSGDISTSSASGSAWSSKLELVGRSKCIGEDFSERSRGDIFIYNYVRCLITDNKHEYNINTWRQIHADGTRILFRAQVVQCSSDCERCIEEFFLFFGLVSNFLARTNDYRFLLLLPRGLSNLSREEPACALTRVTGISVLKNQNFLALPRYYYDVCRNSLMLYEFLVPSPNIFSRANEFDLC